MMTDFWASADEPQIEEDIIYTSMPVVGEYDYLYMYPTQQPKTSEKIFLLAVIILGGIYLLKTMK